MDFSKVKIIGGKRHPGGDYQPVVVEIYHEIKSGKGDSKHVRAIEGQPFSSDLDVQFDEMLKSRSAVGTKFLLWGKLSRRRGGGEYINSSWRWSPEPIPEDQK